jgi:subtilase family serine protease
VYLSKDAVLTTLDTRIGFVTAAALSPGAAQTVTVNATVPASLAPGGYYLGAVADALSLVAESDEGNNALAGSTLAVSGSDLAVVSVSGPSTGLTGQTVPVTVTVRNVGPGSAPSSNLSVYLSRDAAVTTMDTRIGSVPTAPLAPGAEQTVTVNAAIPASLSPGSWVLGAIVDALSLVPEPNEANNALAGNTLVVSGSDLAIASVSGPTTGIRGQTVPVTVTIRNLGPGAAPSAYLYVYLSRDSAITLFDTRIGWVVAGALAAGAEQTVTVNAAIPASLATGTWYLGAIADALALIPEGSESNNALAGNTLVLGAGP